MLGVLEPTRVREAERAGEVTQRLTGTGSARFSEARVAGGGAELSWQVGGVLERLEGVGNGVPVVDGVGWLVGPVEYRPAGVGDRGEINDGHRGEVPPGVS